jgi:hypothetical protein
MTSLVPIKKAQELQAQAQEAKAQSGNEATGDSFATQR